MKKEGIKKWIDDVYTKFCALFSLYEETDHFTKVPERETDKDSKSFLDRKFKEIYDNINNFTLYMDDDEISKLKVVEPGLFLFDHEAGEIAGRLSDIARETWGYIYKREPANLMHWEMLNRNLLYFAKIFDLMEEHPEDYKEILFERQMLAEIEKRIALGQPVDEEFLTRTEECIRNPGFYHFPDAEAIAERNAYFEKIREQNKQENVTWSKTRILQEELLHTMKLLFEEEFKKYLYIVGD